MEGRFPHPSSSTSSLLSPANGFDSRSNSAHSLAQYSGDSSARLSPGLPLSVSEKYSLPPSPAAWGMPLLMNDSEADDDLHNPDPKRDMASDRGGTILTPRGLANLGCLLILALGCLMLFAGFPVLSFVVKKVQKNQGGFNLGGINATGQVPNFPGNWGLIDKDTPREAYTRKSFMNDDEYVLVFSDEFNLDGRSFYPGDDPYWEAVNLHYWGTNDLEWYDPMQATTGNGSLLLTLDSVPDPTNNHNLNYRSAMVQSWNKFCFTGGILETSVRLPGSNTVPGLWPAVWTMGNLGRAGYGATVEGLWPFSYDACDVGTLPNQTWPGTQKPLWAVQHGDPHNNDMLSYLPGQRLSACTCSGESHPGPMRSDGSYVGRAAPEIDVFEATVTKDVGGQVSLSAQWAPYNAEYKWKNTTDNMIIYDLDKTELNTYVGGAYQQTTSGISKTNQQCYELTGGCFALYAFEYKPGFDNAYITWVNDNQPAWTLNVAGMGPDDRSEISARAIPMEPMYLIANLGFSHNFGDINFDDITFPTTMSVDYIRVYQPKGAVNIGCNPDSFPTTKYIDTYKEVYTNPNLTTWEQYGQPWPKNKLSGCL
ncbi:glycoside hydrolase family 16 protein [Macrolepiota fuliginosa MF-IS2]|uniref:Glycoside hydrolase family 16 protein n=1 Tax=Macrolepiota fuliginosa MF-IS2 TaxID=1400762 RepID=A0A9P5X8D2_9AGAR|nr:glycoside hydrolase family 16 protein [Macrolepiota fuliginosa MF-IS2]